MKRAVAPLLWLCGLAYPFAVYFALGKVAVTWLALPLALLWLLKALTDKALSRIFPLSMAVFLVVLGLFDSLSEADTTMALSFYPVLVNAMLLMAFASSLMSGMPLIERLARLRHGDLPEEGVRYTRRVTQVWCVFFAANGSIAAWLAIYGSLESWTLYNGLISYLLIGALLLGEWLIRRKLGKRV